ncbi:MAG TPA: peptidylprolyl isomerase [Pseudolabrys sp.]
MQKHLVTIVCLALLGLSLGGCTKCGDWLWEQGPHSCHSGMPR